MAILLIILVGFGSLAMAGPDFNDVVEEQHYTIDELEAMGDRGDWMELVFRMDSVIPGQRGDKWEQLVEKAAINYLKAPDTFAGTDRMADELMNRFPSLQRSKAYLHERMQVRLKQLDLCFPTVAGEEDCALKVLAFAQENTADAELVRQGAEIVAHRESPGMAIAIYKILIESERQGAGECEQPAVRRSLLSALASRNTETQRVALQLAMGACWNAVRADLGREIQKSTNGNLLSASCQVYRQKGLTREPAMHRCPALRFPRK